MYHTVFKFAHIIFSHQIMKYYYQNIIKTKKSVFKSTRSNACHTCLQEKSKSFDDNNDNNVSHKTM
jgi:hypothetical protein